MCKSIKWFEKWEDFWVRRHGINIEKHFPSNNLLFIMYYGTDIARAYSGPFVISPQFVRHVRNCVNSSSNNSIRDFVVRWQNDAARWGWCSYWPKAPTAMIRHFSRQFLCGYRRPDWLYLSQSLPLAFPCCISIIKLEQPSITDRSVKSERYLTRSQ